MAATQFIFCEELRKHSPRIAANLTVLLTDVHIGHFRIKYYPTETDQVPWELYARDRDAISHASHNLRHVFFCTILNLEDSRRAFVHEAIETG